VSAHANAPKFKIPHKLFPPKYLKLEQLLWLLWPRELNFNGRKTNTTTWTVQAKSLNTSTTSQSYISGGGFNGRWMDTYPWWPMNTVRSTKRFVRSCRTKIEPSYKSPKKLLRQYFRIHEETVFFLFRKIKVYVNEPGQFSS